MSCAWAIIRTGRPEGLADIRNKSAYLAGIMSRVRKENDRSLSTLHPMSRTDTPLTRVTNNTTYNVTDDQVFDQIALRVRAKITELQTRSSDSVTFDRKSLVFLKSMPEKLAMAVLDDLSKMSPSHRSAGTYATLNYLHNQLSSVYNGNYDKKENLASQVRIPNFLSFFSSRCWAELEKPFCMCVKFRPMQNLETNGRH